MPNARARTDLHGLLVIDKPVGPTSHDVVARMRRTLGERRIGHTGTLDPGASGVLPLVLGKATRLARFLTAADKSYDATVRLGVSTDSYDAAGAPVGAAYEGPLPGRSAIETALAAFVGARLQQAPAFSAKKIAGRRSYRIARDARSDAAEPQLPEPSPVAAYRLEVLAVDGADVRLRLDCSAGFYVRTLAHELGGALGTGAHLIALRRTRSGELTLADALPLSRAEAHPEEAAAAVVPLEGMLTSMPGIELTAEGVRRAGHGRVLGPDDVARQVPGSDSRRTGPLPTGAFRMLTGEGGLVGIAEARNDDPKLLHPLVVLM